MIACQSCGHVNPSDANYCSSCGTAIAISFDEATGSLPAVDTNLRSDDTRILEITEGLPLGVAFLVHHLGPEAGSWFSLEREMTTIGRHPNSDIFLNDVTVSRRHAQVRRQGVQFIIVDVGSLNGTYVNRGRVEEVELFHGNEIQIGKFRFLFIQHPGVQ
ncbi:MAG: FHA domain-containing protein [Ferrimicrobium sp.]